MNTEKIDIFLKTLKIGSMKMAAQKLGYTQSGLHYIINSLEDELGLPITNRSNKGLFLNDEGVRLLPSIEKLVQAHTDLMREASKLAKKNHPLRIGVLPCMSASILPGIIKRFTEEHPGTTVDVRVEFSDLIRSIEFGEIDIAILPRYVAGNYAYHHLLSTHFCAALPASMVAEETESITVEEFVKLPLIITTTNPENKVFQALTKHSISCTMQCSVLGATALLAMVEQGLGATYLSALYDTQCPPGVKIVSFEPTYSYDIGIIANPSSESVSLINSFIRIAQTYCESL